MIWLSRLFVLFFALVGVLHAALLFGNAFDPNSSVFSYAVHLFWIGWSLFFVKLQIGNIIRMQGFNKTKHIQLQLDDIV